MSPKFESEKPMIHWFDEHGNEHPSEVYYIDANRDRFLVTNDKGYFKWVDTKDCKVSRT